MDEAGGLSAEEFATVETIAARIVAAGLPSGEVRVHVGECGSTRCPRHGEYEGVARARRVGVRVSLDLGDGIVVEREYGATARS